MTNIFQSLSGRKPKKSSFDLTHNRKFSFAPGMCYPILCQEALPGDKWSYDVSTLVRFMPMINPIMHMVDVCVYSFSVPDRLTMQRGGFEVFITGGPTGNGNDAAGNVMAIPRCNFAVAPDATHVAAGQLGVGSLADYLGIAFGDINVGDGVVLNMMPFIAFWRIWTEYVRDQNLHPDYVTLYPGIFASQGDITAAIIAALGDAMNPFAFFDIPQVCWEKDYFTSALPFAQRGSPVETPLSGTADVTYRVPAEIISGAAGTPTQALGVRDGTEILNRSSDGTFDNAGGDAGLDNIEEVELTTGGFTINALRVAARLQEWLERMARGGARYIEQMKSQFGVTSSDARLQRPEMLGGGKIPVHISEVLQTSATDSVGGTNTPLGEMAGHGVAAGKVAGWSKYFEEHCLIISLMFLRPKPAYQQGISRLFTRRFNKLDWAWPSFAHLGEQEIYMSEIYATMTSGDLVDIFGYQQRYAEYKYIPSTVHGEFRTTLDAYHWGRIFATEPALTPEFVACDPDPRIFNVLQATDPLFAIVTNRINCIRPLPYHGEPTL